MTPDKPQPSRLELVKAGKLEERRSERRPHILEQQPVPVIEEKPEGFKFRTEMVVIFLLVILLLILTFAGLK